MITDIHTHILPGIDDGAQNVDISLQMLRTQYDQGVGTIVLTPHFYRRRETAESFFHNRNNAYALLRDAMAAEQRDFPQLYLAAEVAWAPNMSEWDELPELCIEGTRNLLLEMPFGTWSSETIRQVYGIINRGITPVFAHLERYVDEQRPEYISEIISMGMPIQVSSSPLLHLGQRKTIRRMIKNGCAHIMASDCHNMSTRLPNLPQGLKMVEKLFDRDTALIMEENAESVLPLK